MSAITKTLRHQSRKLRESARGQQCTVRIPGHCNWNTETTCLAHLGGGGMGTKKSDLQAAFACSGCHDVCDGRVKPVDGLSNLAIKVAFYEGIERTQQYWLDAGLVVLA